jgi:putative cell wall-binding protein
VYLARSDVFADSVAAGSLTDGPVLLVPSCGTAPSAVKAEVDRLNPGRVVALGGSGAVCDRLLDDVGAGRSTSRLAGESRVATSAAIARAAFPAGAATVYLARSDVLADAVAAGTLTDGPVVLVPACGDVPPVVADAIRALDPNDVIALGGPSAVCDGMLSQAAAARSTTPASTGRLAGADRYGTAAAISARQWNSTKPATAYVARGDVFADAVASGSLADGPVLLVPPCGPLPAAVTAELGRAQPSAIVALGGPAAVCSMTVDIAATDGTPPPNA